LIERHDIAEILLKLVLNTNQSIINHWFIWQKKVLIWFHLVVGFGSNFREDLKKHFNIVWVLW